MFVQKVLLPAARCLLKQKQRGVGDRSGLWGQLGVTSVSATGFSQSVDGGFVQELEGFFHLGDTCPRLLAISWSKALGYLSPKGKTRVSLQTRRRLSDLIQFL